jgi:hypothetical protein
MFLADVRTDLFEVRLHVEKTKYEVIYDLDSLSVDDTTLDPEYIEAEFQKWGNTKLWSPELGPNRDVRVLVPAPTSKNLMTHQTSNLSQPGGAHEICSTPPPVTMSSHP